MEFGTDESVKIDLAHAALIQSLVVCNKPESILEIGLGGGKSTDAILDGVAFNAISPYQYTLVDNWFDWNGVRPEGVDEKYGKKLHIVDMDEREFVFSTKKTYDFIMSDGDHHRTDQWFEHVYENLLNPGGILIYHDVNFIDDDAFKNLQNIHHKAVEYGLKFKLFNKNSRPDERCQRGLMVIFKD